MESYRIDLQGGNDREGNLSSLTRKGHQSPSVRACPDSLLYSKRVQDASRYATLNSRTAKEVKDFHNPISEEGAKSYCVDLQEEMKFSYGGKQ